MRTRGDYVYELVREGAGMTALRVGLVTRAGDRQYEVRWEGGHVRRYPQGHGHEIMDWRGWSDAERAGAIALIGGFPS